MITESDKITIYASVLEGLMSGAGYWLKGTKPTAREIERLVEDANAIAGAAYEVFEGGPVSQG
jgi:hypothetical protein